MSEIIEWLIKHKEYYNLSALAKRIGVAPSRLHLVVNRKAALSGAQEYDLSNVLKEVSYIGVVLNSVNSYRWTDLQLQLLHKYYNEIDIDVLSDMLDRSTDAIEKKASDLGITGKKKKGRSFKK